MMSFLLGGMLTVLQSYATTKIEYVIGLALMLVIFTSFFVAFLRRLHMQQLVKRYEVQCELCILQQQLQCVAFVDTGNQSIEPISGQAIHYATIQLLATLPSLQQGFLQWDAEKPFDLSMFPKQIRRLLHPVSITTIEKRSLVLACSCSLIVNQQRLAQQFVVFIQEPLQFH